MSARQVGAPVSSRAWRWTIEAPARTQRSASAAISSGVTGTAGLSSFVGTIPVRAAFTISGCTSSPPLDAFLDDSRRQAENLNRVGNILRDDRSRADDGSAPNRHAVDDDRARRDERRLGDAAEPGH